MTKLYFWIHRYFFRPGCRVVWAALMAVPITWEVAELMPAHMAGLVAAHMPGDAAPGYTVSLGTLPPVMLSQAFSLNMRMEYRYNSPSSGNRPGTSQIGASPLSTPHTIHIMH